MTASGLIGSFPLTKEAIDKAIRHSSAGTYALGHLVDDKFRTLYVGYADSNLKRDLQRRVGQAPRFKYQLFDDPKAAFDKQCELFHFLKPKGNAHHPKAPATRNWKCPDCGL